MTTSTSPGVIGKIVTKGENFFLGVSEGGFMPDAVIRYGCKKMLQQTIKDCQFGGDIEKQRNNLEAYIGKLKTRNIAEQTAAANKQHYEVPTKLYKLFLGPWLKYSSGYWPEGCKTLKESEEAMLNLVCERAELDQLAEGSSVLDLGCGWGSFALFAAQKYPKLNFSCVSNSKTQREFILERAKEMGVTNLEPKTSDINVLEYPAGSFDRVCSTEMFEHMKNYEKLMFKVFTWLKPKGKLFVHIFTHRDCAYDFEAGWMTETFFTGGTMPNVELLTRFNKHMTVEKQWAVNGSHYGKTLDAWLAQIDAHKTEFLKLCGEIYGKGQEKKWLFNWRLFHIASSECFWLNKGNEFFVSHYRFVKKE